MCRVFCAAGKDLRDAASEEREPLSTTLRSMPKLTPYGPVGMKVRRLQKYTNYWGNTIPMMSQYLKFEFHI